MESESNTGARIEQLLAERDALSKRYEELEQKPKEFLTEEEMTEQNEISKKREEIILELSNLENPQ